MTIHWPETQAERIAVLSAIFAQGAGRTEAAAQLGISVHSVSGFCFRHGLKPTRAPNTEWARLGTTEARLARVRDLDAAGLDATAIASELGVSRTAIIAMTRDAKSPLLNSGPRARIMPRFEVLPDLPPETWLRPHDGPVLADGCEWPIEVDGKPAGKCGAARSRRSYCAHHHALAYQPSSAGRVLEVAEKAMRRRPVSSAAAMKMTGVAARRVEVVK